jgi:hypothetical protein
MMTDCPYCFGAINPESVAPGRLRCDNCGSEYAGVLVPTNISGGPDEPEMPLDEHAEEAVL